MLCSAISELVVAFASFVSVSVSRLSSLVMSVCVKEEYDEECVCVYHRLLSINS